MPSNYIVPRRIGDARGWFSETYSRRQLSEDYGIEVDFLQDNHSFSAQQGTLRGIHFQRPPHAQAKLVRCVAGAIWDVAIDLRAGSPTFGQWAAAELTSDGGEQFYIPVGFGHAFITLTPNAEVVYKASAYYEPHSEDGLIWNDPDLAIAWPVGPVEPTLSDKDQALPRLCDFESPFTYDGEPLTSLDLGSPFACSTRAF